MGKRVYLISFLIFVFLIGFIFLFATGNIDSYKNSEKEDMDKIRKKSRVLRILTVLMKTRVQLIIVVI